MLGSSQSPRRLLAVGSAASVSPLLRNDDDAIQHPPLSARTRRFPRARHPTDALTLCTSKQQARTCPGARPSRPPRLRAGQRDAGTSES
jgi:hypothetical protein